MNVVGKISDLWRFPVKSMGGEQLEETPMTAAGILGDRTYALLDTDTGRVVSAKSAKLFPDVLNCTAAFVEAPQSGAKLPPVSVSLPDGTVVRSDAPGADQALSAHFKRNVTLIQTAPDDFVIDAYLPNIEGATPPGMGDTTVLVKLGAALFARLGLGSPIPAGSFFDVFPITLLTSSTLDHLSNQQLESRFDVRRFRMNVIVATTRGGFIENDWVGGTLRVGETAHLSITMNDPRCVMVTLAQADLPKDTDILRALVRENMREVGTMGTFPCAGVYAAVETPGTIRVGDDVALISCESDSRTRDEAARGSGLT